MNVQVLSWQVSVPRVRPTPAELAATYSHMAHVWTHKTHRLGFHRAYTDLFTRLQPLLFADADILTRAAVLDCGIGTGELSLALHRTIRRAWSFHGVDISHGMVDEARRRFHNEGLMLTAHTRNVCNLPYADDEFGLVMSAHAIEHLSAPRIGLAEMARVLRPGAPLLLVTTRQSLLGSLLAVQWGLQRVSRRTLVEWMRELGLVDVAFHPLGGPPWCRWMSMACVAKKTD